MAMLADTLTTRDAVRRATADDIIGRCQAAGVAIEGGELDGVVVVSMGTLRDQVSASLLVKLPPPSEKHAEVKTPATVVVSAMCPECALPVEIVVKLTPALTVDNNGAEVSFDAPERGRLVFHTDAFGSLQENLRAISLGLTALRAIERYGITTSAEQYAGFAQLSAGGPDSDRGARLVAEHGSVAAALKATHPDHGGDTQQFADVQAYRTAVGASAR